MPHMSDLIWTPNKAKTRRGVSVPSETMRLWRNFDFLLLAAVILLVLIGILFIRSATLGAIDTDLIGRVRSQIIFAVMGLSVMFILSALDYRLLATLQHYIYGTLVFSLGLVAVAGQVGGAGAQRWLDVGVQVQPSEIGKMLIIIALAAHFTRQHAKLGRFSTVLISIAYMAVPMFLIFIQPNLGNTIAFGVIWFVMAWGAGLRLHHILILVVTVLVALPILWANMEDYQRSRITTFISINSGNTDLVDTEELRDARYNIDQSLISVGSGGLLGRGYANGTQTQGRFLRVRHTDFIFSVIAHETGFVGGVITLSLIAFVIYRILRVAELARDPVGSLICYGVASVIFFQTVTAVGMNLAILPVTGLTLPFVSSGGTSLLSLLFGVGLVQSVMMRRKLYRG